MTLFTIGQTISHDTNIRLVWLDCLIDLGLGGGGMLLRCIWDGVCKAVQILRCINNLLGSVNLWFIAVTEL